MDSLHKHAIALALCAALPFGTVPVGAGLLAAGLVGAGLGTALPSAAAAQERGPVTNLPLPRYVSMKAAEGNARRGPSRTHRIDWIFTRRDLPLEITAEHGHWRRVRDRDGVGGWMHYSLLSGVRTAIVERDMVAMRASPNSDAMVNAQLEVGVIARVDECSISWCELQVSGHKGWVPKAAIWGVGTNEILD
ncbi:SH3 domain-containing protein [Roseovarius sp. D0-M9]|uniref:SH3 domain-containing protein n=1 Tax=Roseovarius sp. D0-M9 TaxID=3127117 RepID=UPI0030102C6B